MVRAKSPAVHCLGGTAGFTTSTLSAGTHAITAVYDGNANLAASTSAALSQKITRGGTLTALTAKPNPSKPGQAVRLDVTVTAKAPAAWNAFGRRHVQHWQQGRSRDRQPCGRKGTLATTDLTIGDHTVTARYAASPDFTASKADATATVDPRVGPEFQVNTFTTGAQQQPAIAPLTYGGFVASPSGAPPAGTAPA